MSRPVPVPDELTAPFWSAAARGELIVQRCSTCARYQHPPVVLCRSCTSADLAFVPVSGRATLHSWTEIRSGARHAAFVERMPYVLALVQLVEQEDLLLYTNLPGASLGALRAGTEVDVEFETLDDVTSLPQFRVRA